MSKLFYWLLLSAAVTLAAEEALFECDFAAEPDKSIFANVANGKVANGILTLDGLIKPNYALRKLTFPVDRPVTITFQARMVEVSGAKDTQWGVILFCGDGETKQRFYTRGTGLISYRLKNKIEQSHVKLNNTYLFRQGADAPWSTISIMIRENDFSVSIDGELIGADQAAILPVKAIDFYAMNVNVQIDNLSITPIVKSNDLRQAATESPIFYANFDQSDDAIDQHGKPIRPLAAKNLKSVAGVSGKAVQIANPAPNQLKLVGNWQWIDGAMFTKNNKSTQKINLAVPNLNSLELEMKFRRLKLDPKDQHIGVMIRGENNRAVQLFTRNDDWTIIRLENNKAISAAKIQFPPLPDAGDNSPWVAVKLALSGRNGTLTVDGVTKTFDSENIFPLQDLNIQAYNLDAGVDDFNVHGFDNAYAKPFDFSETFDRFSTAAAKPELRYPIADRPGAAGGIMFWVSPLWDGETGPDPMPIYPLVYGLNDQNETRMNLRMISVLNAGLGREADKKLTQLNRKVRPIWFKNDWNHVALTYDDADVAKLFVNGLPYYPNNCEMPIRELLQNPDIKSISTLLVGSDGTLTAEANFDEIKLFRKVLTNDDVYREYRKFMPIDLVMNRSVLNPDVEETVAVQLAPGGHFMRPKPVDTPDIPAAIELKLEVLNAAGVVLKTLEQSLNVDRELDVALPVGKLEPGEYRVRCTVTSPQGTIQRSFLLTSWRTRQANAESREDLKLGKTIFEHNLADDKGKSLLTQGNATPVDSKLGFYVEAGEKKGNRLSLEVNFAPEQLTGKPVLLQIYWPDDKARMMGFYMYPESGYANHRDRLQGGLQAGNEYPNSNQMQVASYLFYPGVQRYLFEVRTMANHFPAALAKVKISEIDGDLPKLAITYPADLPHRKFGYSDEDQTFDSNLNRDDVKLSASVFRTQKVLDLLLEYMDYTGQDLLNYPMLRYYYSFQAYEGTAGNRLPPYRPGELSYLIEAFARRNKGVNAIVHMHDLPELYRMPEKLEEFDRQGMLCHLKDGSIAKRRVHYRWNLHHPAVEKIWLTKLDQFLAREGKLPGLEGIEYWIQYLGTWLNLDHGYDDYTVDLFSKETGIKVPGGTSDTRFAQRYAFLTGSQRAAWLRWRAGKTTDLVRKVRALIDQHNPALVLMIGVKATTGPTATVNNILVEDTPNRPLDFFYENSAIDAKAIAAIPGVFVTPIREYLSYRWNYHWGNPESRQDERFYDPARSEMFKTNGFGAMSTSYPSYFETFEKSLNQAKFAAYFQNADVRPHGRYFLKELAFNLATLDAMRITIGAQVLGTMGRDEEAREFAAAFGALPALPFLPVPGSTDPVTARYLNTPDGCYLYTVSMTIGDSKVKLSPAVKLQDLSTGETVNSDDIRLKPYQLRSFFIPKMQMKFDALETVIDPETVKFYRTKLDRLAAILTQLQSLGLSVQVEQQRYLELEKLFQSGAFAELHRLIFSLAMNQLSKQAENTDALLEQAEMRKKNQFRINCGSDKFVKSRDGKLFSPDQRFDPATGGYGYFGSHLTVERNTDGLTDPDGPEIFQTEAYNLDGYRFAVPPGKYQLKLWMKVGYKPSQKINTVRFNVALQGRTVLSDFDPFKAANADPNQAATMTFNNVEPDRNGLIEVKFTASDPNARLLNALELIRIP